MCPDTAVTAGSTMVRRGGVMLQTGLVLCINSGYITELQEPDKELNVNRYATKKTAAQGM